MGWQWWVIKHRKQSNHQSPADGVAMHPSRALGITFTVKLSVPPCCWSTNWFPFLAAWSPVANRWVRSKFCVWRRWTAKRCQEGDQGFDFNKFQRQWRGQNIPSKTLRNDKIDKAVAGDRSCASQAHKHRCTWGLYHTSLAHQRFVKSAWFEYVLSRAARSWA